MTFLEHNEAIKYAGDAAAAVVTVGTLLSYLPYVAAVFTIVWTGLRIFEMFHGDGAIRKWWRKRK